MSGLSTTLISFYSQRQLGEYSTSTKEYLDNYYNMHIYMHETTRATYSKVPYMVYHSEWLYYGCIVQLHPITNTCTHVHVCTCMYVCTHAHTHTLSGDSHAATLVLCMMWTREQDKLNTVKPLLTATQGDQPRVNSNLRGPSKS